MACLCFDLSSTQALELFNHSKNEHKCGARELHHPSPDNRQDAPFRSRGRGPFSD